ncbi:MAG: hypothetical protein QM741_08435 [Rudaea sp.]|uniref:hypothetical protein n=1 Tax=Rudaea sp. TaxID=2136325 RepID=UPI0039E21D98
MNSNVSIRPAVLSERRFFLWMSLAIAATVFAGFGRIEAAGFVRWTELPFQVVAHGLVFAAWIMLFVVQCALVDRGSVALHRRLGVFGAALAAAMVPLALVTAVMCIRRGAVPPVFRPDVFLALNLLNVVAFAGLLAAGLALRRRPDWHRRLMLCGNVIIMSPAVPRLLPLSALGVPVPLILTCAMLAYVGAGMAFDLANRRRIHRAWWVGAGVIVGMMLALGPLAYSAPLRALVDRLSPP